MSVTWGSLIELLLKSKLENYFVNQSVLNIDYTDLYVNNIVYIYMISSFFVFVLQVTCRCDCKLPVAGAEYNPVTKDEYKLLLLLNIIEVLVFGH